MVIVLRKQVELTHIKQRASRGTRAKESIPLRSEQVTVHSLHPELSDKTQRFHNRVGELLGKIAALEIETAGLKAKLDAEQKEKARLLSEIEGLQCTKTFLKSQRNALEEEVADFKSAMPAINIFRNALENENIELLAENNILERQSNNLKEAAKVGYAVRKREISAFVEREQKAGRLLSCGIEGTHRGIWRDHGNKSAHEACVFVDARLNSRIDASDTAFTAIYSVSPRVALALEDSKIMGTLLNYVGTIRFMSAENPGLEGLVEQILSHFWQIVPPTSDCWQADLPIEEPYLKRLEECVVLQGITEKLEEVKMLANNRRMGRSWCENCKKTGHAEVNCGKKLVCQKCNNRGHLTSKCTATEKTQIR